MSIKNWNAGIIRPVAVAPAGPLATGAAPGVWTLDQQAFWQKQGLWPIAGNNLYIEDVFSTYLYTGNSTSGGTQTITNGVDLSTKGGMVWIKGRSATANNVLFDTTRGAGTTASNNQALSSNLTTAEDLGASYDFLSAFNTDGFTVKQGGTSVQTRGTNYDATTYASWTFRKQAKFFDIVTYTGNGVARTIAHNLGSVPGCMIIKCTSTTSDWYVYHRSVDNGSGQAYLALNTAAAAASTLAFTNTPPTSTVFYVGDGVGQNPINQNGATYVAYLFAHNAGGFGASGSDNVISCGSFTGSNVSNVTVSLGYEPQFILWKTATSADSWKIADNMRGMPIGSGLSSSTANLFPNASTAEAVQNGVAPTATGFTWYANGAVAASDTYIYIAIRRGPMKTPTSGTSVFAPNDGTGSTSGQSISTNFPVDLAMTAYKIAGIVAITNDRLRGFGTTNTAGVTPALETSTTGAESVYSGSNPWFYNAWNSSITRGSNGADPSGGLVSWLFRRAPGFFDVVCYTGTGANRTVSHNLGVAPELMIVKARNNTIGYSWFVYVSALGASKVLNLNQTLAEANNSAAWNDTAPTSSVFSLGTSASTNKSGDTYVAYLFATVAGVSKVGSYTGSGTTKQIDCGFTGGARFVLIKRTDSTGDWYVWDSARGIVAGNDPYLLLNSTAAEVTGTDYVDTYSAGFEISSTAPAAINANGGTFIFLAIA